MVGFPHNSFRDNVGNHDAQFSKWKSNPGEISYLGLHMRKKKNHSRIMVCAKSITLYLTSVDNFAPFITEIMIPGFSLSKDNGCF